MVSTTPTSQVDPGYVIGFCWSKDLGPKSASKSEPRVCHGYRMDIEVASKSGPRVSRLESVCVCVWVCVCVCPRSPFCRMPAMCGQTFGRLTCLTSKLPCDFLRALQTRNPPCEALNPGTPEPGTPELSNRSCPKTPPAHSAGSAIEGAPKLCPLTRPAAGSPPQPNH